MWIEQGIKYGGGGEVRGIGWTCGIKLGSPECTGYVQQQNEYNQYRNHGGEHRRCTADDRRLFENAGTTE
jgi:hypothetical protein